MRSTEHRVTATEGQLAEVVRDILHPPRREFDPWFYQYCGDLVDSDNLATYVRHKSDLLRFAGIDPRGARILDAGAGFGLTLVVLAAFGAATACGIEFHEPMVRTAKAYASMLPRKLRERISIEHGDVMAMPYPDETFDAVLSVEAVSHYRDVEAALLEIHRVLRRGGVVAVSDGNNGLNPLTRRRTRELWDAFELGSTREKMGRHRVSHNYQAERETFIREHFPDLPADRVARETFGMTYDEVAEACAVYRRERTLPGSIYDGSDVPVNPDDGQVIERLINPYALGRTPREDGICGQGQRLLGRRERPEVVADRECRPCADLATDDLLSPWLPHRGAEKRGGSAGAPEGFRHATTPA
jgi:SAM-dependent methyltransferase